MATGIVSTTLVAITPLANRAKWAQVRTHLDELSASAREHESKRVAMSPAVQQVCERITKGVESLLEAIGEGHKLWIRGGCNEADREALQAAAALVGRRLGKPVP